MESVDPHVLQGPDGQHIALQLQPFHTIRSARSSKKCLVEEELMWRGGGGGGSWGMAHDHDFWRPGAFRGRHKDGHSILVQTTFSIGRWHSAAGERKVRGGRLIVKLLRLEAQK